MWFEIPKDYQQDNLISSWRQLSQSGTTYHLSGILHYVHLMCLESNEKSQRPSQLSRNLIYIFEDRIAGSKTGDKTLSTIADVFLGSSKPTAVQPKLLPSGYD